MSKYETLTKILDQLRKEAPSKIGRYYPSTENTETLNQLRARTFIHLFLKVKFGLTDFQQRENFITDDTQDGGVDAYYINQENKRIYFIQSKFRTTEVNFNSKEILLSELLQMDIDRITNGEELDERGIAYNGRIKSLIKKVSEIPDISRWNYEVIILANLSRSITPIQIRRLTGLPTTVFDYEKAYEELVFPVVQGTYYDLNELMLSISLFNTTASNSRVTYRVQTNSTECDITILFVPTIEIAKALYKYRNSILKFNPRSYLELSKNTVNKAIRKTITDIQTNEFALYNNGITLLSFGTDFSERIGQKDKAQLMLTQPQIINGGQTAYTLSRLYEEKLSSRENPEELFANKEVLLKIITFNSDSGKNVNNYLELIEEISKATNQQSPVDEADRRSNDQIQIKLQKFIFDKYGYFYERKRGEFGDGIREEYIDQNQIVDREDFLRMCHCCDMKPAEAWRSIGRQFDQLTFNQILYDEARFPEYFFAYKCFETLSSIKIPRNKSKRSSIEKYGSGLTYGKYAVITACRTKYKGEEAISSASEIAREVLDNWLKFENFAMSLQANSDYFSEQNRNFNNYYKARNVNHDILSFFNRNTSSSTESTLN